MKHSAFGAAAVALLTAAPLESRRPTVLELDSRQAHRPRETRVQGWQVERRLAAILAADVAGYSRLMERDEAGTFARVKELRGG